MCKVLNIVSRGVKNTVSVSNFNLSHGGEVGRHGELAVRVRSNVIQIQSVGDFDQRQALAFRHLEDGFLGDDDVDALLSCQRQAALLHYLRSAALVAMCHRHHNLNRIERGVKLVSHK